MSSSRFASRWNLDAIEAAYERWQQDPASVDESWRYFFEGFELAAGSGQPVNMPGKDAPAQAAVVRLVLGYRDLGHFLARLDPLSAPKQTHPQLELSYYGLDESHLDRIFHSGNFLGLPQGRLRDLLAALKQTYCRTIGVEYQHIQDIAIRRWLQERMEPRLNQPLFDRDKKLRILSQLYYAEMFEQFLHSRYVGQKRFSLEGSETVIPLLEALVGRAPELGVREMVIGMAHRGRLNVLANILRKPYTEIFAEFEENFLPESIDGDGDVKYHLGFSSDRTGPGGKTLHLSLTPNPSHLELVDPVVEGRTRAKQNRFGDHSRTAGLPLLLHGDAAFAGQGLVAETLNLSALAGYTTGGTIHVIINNQIGFTTAPRDARSTVYCTDVAKMIQAPIFHVNGEDPEAAVYLAELALEFRQTFHRDVVIDLFCYRRHGHNEGDEPAFTQPLMYSKIRERPTLSEIYTEQLVLSGDLTVEEHDALKQKFQTKLQNSKDEVKSSPAHFGGTNGFAGQWARMTPLYDFTPAPTAVPRQNLEQLADALTRVPDNFQVHSTITRLLERRRQAVYTDQSIDWPLAELLAFGTLLVEGTPVRLSGQDSRRGTFSQRHAVLYDARTGEPFSPLNVLGPEAAGCFLYDSLLSEAAVLGFEFGYALDSPETMVLWEAQFGDFANGAQAIIDQYIAASQSKWKRDNGIVLLLPHGYEGQGPEHSSARLERYLQLCAEDNMQVCNLSTAGQYFHVLRRQMKRGFRKPLIIMTPKSMLRLKAASSPLEEFVSGRFHEILDDPAADPARAQRVLMCSGKLYWELLEERKQAEQGSLVAIVRFEQFYPLHEELFRTIAARYRKAREWVWVQEESQNMGAWSFLEPRLRALLEREVHYVGRDASASPATGSRTIHLREQKEILETAIHGRGTHLVRATPRGRTAEIQAASRVSK
jgi:2-oxoglutarate dehydrogenase E1 component